MTKTINDGGPAFPPAHDPNTHVFGMTLRDYFAGLALSDSYGQLERLDQFKQCAKAAYEMADAMLKARSV